MQEWTVGLASFFQGERDGSVIIHCNDGYFYHRHHDDDRPGCPFITVRCTKRRSARWPCWGAAVVARDGSYFQCTRLHTHGPDYYSLEERRLRESVLHEIAIGNPQPFSVILRTVGSRGRFSMEARSRVTLNRMRTAMRNERMRFFPPVPATLLELAMYLQDPQYAHVTTTVDGEDNLFAGSCGDFGAGTLSIVFMSRRQGQFMQGSDKCYGDGTFRKRPRRPLSNQMYVLSCVWYNPHTSTKHIITCARILMQRRTFDAYVVLFTYLRALLPAWAPQVFLVDHEVAQVQAIFYIFRGITVFSCLFHFSVDVFRYAKALGMHRLMVESWIVDTVVRCLAVLPLLPANHIVYGMHAMGHWARLMGVMRYPQVRQLFEYVHGQWSPTVQYVSVFGSDDRTNNVSESAHAGLGHEVPENRPNVYVLTGAMKRLEDQAMVDLHGLRRGYNASRPQQLRTLRNDARFLNLQDSYLRNNINVVTFLIEASMANRAPYDAVFH